MHQVPMTDELGEPLRARFSSQLLTVDRFAYVVYTRNHPFRYTPIGHLPVNGLARSARGSASFEKHRMRLRCIGPTSNTTNYKFRDRHNAHATCVEQAGQRNHSHPGTTVRFGREQLCEKSTQLLTKT